MCFHRTFSLCTVNAEGHLLETKQTLLIHPAALRADQTSEKSLDSIFSHTMLRAVFLKTLLSVGCTCTLLMSTKHRPLLGMSEFKH